MGRGGGRDGIGWRGKVVVLLEGARLYTEPCRASRVVRLYTEPCRAGRVVRLQTEPNGGWVVRKG